MKMFLLQKVNPFFQTSASANRYRTLIEGLAELGVEIELLITGGFLTTAEFQQMGRKGVLKYIRYQYLNLFFYNNIWLRRVNHYILEPLFNIWIGNKIRKIIKINPKCIFWSSTDITDLKLIYKLKKDDPNIKSFIELSEFLDIHQLHKGNVLQRKEGDARQLFFDQKAFYAFNGIALMTKTLLKHYQSFPGTKPKFLHLPMTVDLERFSQPKNMPIRDGLTAPYIAFIGTMSNNKEGVDILISAFHKLVEIHPKLKLYLFGFYHSDIGLHLEQTKMLNLDNRVFYKGSVSRDEIPAIIMNAQLLVLPRPDSKQAQGGFPTKLGEYLATGNPVCATTVGEIPDYLVDGESVYFAEPGSVDSFADAMHRALRNPVLAKQVGVNGRKVAEECFNKDIQAKILYDFLDENFNDK